MEKTIKSVSYIDDHGMENTYTVGINNVLRIEEYRPKGEGDRWFYDVAFEDRTERLFRFSSVTFTH